LLCFTCPASFVLPLAWPAGGAKSRKKQMVAFSRLARERSQKMCTYYSQCKKCVGTALPAFTTVRRLLPSSRKIEVCRTHRESESQCKRVRQESCQDVNGAIWMDNSQASSISRRYLAFFLAPSWQVSPNPRFTQRPHGRSESEKRSEGKA
jgi:hypothetical protein